MEHGDVFAGLLSTVVKIFAGVVLLAACSFSTPTAQAIGAEFVEAATLLKAIEIREQNPPSQDPKELLLVTRLDAYIAGVLEGIDFARAAGFEPPYNTAATYPMHNAELYGLIKEYAKANPVLRNGPSSVLIMGALAKRYPNPKYKPNLGP